MGYFSLILIFLVVMIFVSASRKNKREQEGHIENKKLKFDEYMTKEEIIAAIKNISDLKQVEKKYNSFSEKSFNNYGKYNRVSEKYYEAYTIGCEKVFKKQFVVNDELNTPYEVLKQSYKVFSVNDDFIETSSPYNEFGYWVDFTGLDLLQNPIDDLLEEKPDYINGAIKFRKIVESDGLKDVKIRKLKNLIKSDESFRENFAEDEDALENLIEKYFS